VPIIKTQPIRKKPIDFNNVFEEGNQAGIREAVKWIIASRVLVEWSDETNRLLRAKFKEWGID